MTHRIVTRAEWGARYARGFAAAPIPAERVWLHHTATAAPTPDREIVAVRQIEQIGQDRFGGGVSYTFLVAPSGAIYEGHGVDRRGAHTKGDNTAGRAICLIGNYDTAATPSREQLDAVAWLLRHGADPARRWWKTPRLAGGHRDAPGAATACPGRHAWAAIPVINGLAAATTPTATPQEDDDMPTAREIADAILDTPIPRNGLNIPPDLVGGMTSLRNEVSWITYALINLPWTAPGPGAEVGQLVKALGAAGSSTPDELRALRGQLARIEQRLDELGAPLAGDGGPGVTAVVPDDLRAALTEALSGITLHLSKGTPA